MRQRIFQWILRLSRVGLLACLAAEQPLRRDGRPEAYPTQRLSPSGTHTPMPWVACPGNRSVEDAVAIRQLFAKGPIDNRPPVANRPHTGAS